MNDPQGVDDQWNRDCDKHFENNGGKQLNIQVKSHYNVSSTIKSVEDIRGMFPTGEANELNWIVFSTSGVHGTYTDLNDIQRFYNDPIGYRLEEGVESLTYRPELTVLVIQPRLVSLRYGHIYVNEEDIPYLRKLVSSSLHEITQSQLGNLE